MVRPKTDKAILLADFLENWTVLETEMHNMAWNNSLTGVPDKGFGYAFKFLRDAGIIPKEEQQKLRQYYLVRNKIVHDYRQNEDLLTRDMLKDLKKFVDKYRSK